jgi:signal peptidase II
MPSRPLHQAWLLATVVAAVAAIDITAKTLAVQYLSASPISVVPGVNLSLGFNPGVSFGLLAAETPLQRWALTMMTLPIIAGLAVFMWRSVDTIERLSCALIIGGAVGNLLDRMGDGAVTDFIDVHARGWHFPTFNLADVAITCGVSGFLIAALRPPSSAG